MQNGIHDHLQTDKHTHTRQKTTRTTIKDIPAGSNIIHPNVTQI